MASPSPPSRTIICIFRLVYPHAGVCGNVIVKSSLPADGSFQGNGHVTLGHANTHYANNAFLQQLIAAQQMQWATIPQGNQRPATALVDASMNGDIETTLAANLGMNEWALGSGRQD